MSQKKSPRFELRSGNVDALLLALNTADLDAVRDDLLSRFESTPDFFSDDVVALDLRRLEGDGALALDRVIDTLATLRARAIGVVARADQRDWAGGFGLPLLDSQSRRGGKDEAPKEKAGNPESATAGGQAGAGRPGTPARARTARAPSSTARPRKSPRSWRPRTRLPPPAQSPRC